MPYLLLRAARISRRFWTSMRRASAAISFVNLMRGGLFSTDRVSTSAMFLDVIAMDFVTGPPVRLDRSWVTLYTMGAAWLSAG